MPHRKSTDTATGKATEAKAAPQCESLLSRINPLQHGRVTSPSIACQLHALGTPTKLVLEPPFYSRLVAEAGLSVQQKRVYVAELSRFGIAWLGDSDHEPTSHRGHLSTVDTASTRRIASLHIDQPIDMDSFQNASAIELQLFGVPFQMLHNSRRSRWTPGLPVEISNFEQLGLKIDLLREIMGKDCPIGAALPPGSVYEDMRYLIDSGIDFVTLLCQVQHGLANTNSLELAPVDATLDHAAKAIQDAGAKTKLLVSANLLDAKRMFRCLQLGASAVAIDAYVAQHKPKDPTPTKDTLGSVLTTYAPAASNAAMPWLAPAISSLIEELTDHATYAGTSS